MSGSGDLESFKTLRILRKRLDYESKHSVFGYQQAINHAIGFLFLGSGSLTFCNSKESIAYIYISIFPIFSSNPNDNDKFLQPLRHLYILSCISKVLETRDIETKKVVKTNIKIIYKDKKEEYFDTPANVIIKIN
jgi:anaphase-promoting complex subunit 1